MRRRRRGGDDSGTSLADVFAGAMIAAVLILLVMWLQAQADAYEVRKLRRMQRIFDQAFAALGEGDEDIVVDKKKGEIRLRAETAFTTGQWRFEPQEDTRAAFLRTRHKLATVLEQLDLEFQKLRAKDGSAIDARAHVEVLVVGHTDCKGFIRHFRRIGWGGADRKERVVLPDNWDLSVLRAAAMARFLTEPCADGSYECCADGGTECCADGTPDCAESHLKRIDPRWRILPSGRSQFEPRSAAPGGESPLGECAAEDDAAWLSDQRRVMIQIVPRMDKFVVRAGQ